MQTLLALAKAFCPKMSSTDIQRDQENPLMDDDHEIRLLPELLEMILTKAVSVQMYSEDSAKRESDESIFSNLASVDFLWWSSMKKHNLKNKILYHSKVYFQKTKMRSTIIRNNRNFLKEVIQPDRITFPMDTCGCLTEDQVTFLNRLRNDKDKNHELLIMLQDFSSQKYSKMIDCLFLANQTPAALVLERGGEAVKVYISNGKARRTKEFEMEFIERFKRMQKANKLIFNDLLNASVDERLDDVFMLHAKQNKGIELWFWCKTESSLNQLKSLSDDDLREIIQRIYQRLIPEHKITLKPQLIQMNYGLVNDFAERRISIRHVGGLENLIGYRFYETIWRMSKMSKHIGYLKCVTSLADKLYIFQEQKILVYENKYPYHALEPILFDCARLPVSIASCNISKCLYVSFYGNHYIFKVEPELGNRVSEWLSATSKLLISVTSKGDVLVLQLKSGDDMLRIFTPEGTVKRTISMKYYGLGQIKSIQEVIPDVVALVYGGLDSEHTYIGIMSLDEDGSIFRHIEWQQKIYSLSLFRYGDLLIGSDGRRPRKFNFRKGVDVDYYYHYFGIVRLYHWPFESNVARDLLTTDEKIYSIHFDADQKQLYVLSLKMLQIYELNYEDEDYDP